MRLRVLVTWLILATGVSGAVRLSSVRQFGGSDSETVAAMTRDSAGNLYLAGRTYSYDFPASVVQLHPGGSNLWRAGGSATPSPIFGHAASTVFSMAADRAHPGVIFLWTNRGLLRSSDYGNTWTAGSSGLPDARGGTLVVDSRDGRTLYLAAPGGIFKSTDAGATWTSSSMGIAANRAGNYPDQIFLDPSNPATLLAIDSFDGPKLYRSTDAGTNWQLQPAVIGSVVFDAKHPGLVYGLGNSQLSRSTDGGATWGVLNAPSDHFTHLTVDSGGNVYYTSPASGSGVTVSHDGGTTWTIQKFPGYPTALAADADSPAVYVSTEAQVLASNDGFATTRRLSLPTPLFQFGLAPATDPREPGVLFASALAATSDAYVMKLDASGNPIWATYLGGAQEDSATGIAVDGAGNVYVAGTTFSADFPSTPGALASKANTGNFAAKISADGRLIYAATFTEGGSIAGLAVDPAGNAYVAGTLTDLHPGFFFSIPEYNASACKLNPSGSQLLYCAKLGNGHGYAIAADAEGSAYIGGDSSLWKADAGGAVVYQRDLKGIVRAIALDSERRLYVAGNTTSADFATTPGAFQQRFNSFRSSIAGPLVAYSDDHGFVARLSPESGVVLNATFLQGENWDHVLALGIGAGGSITVGGVTASSSLPLSGAIQTRFAYYTGFVSRLSGDLSTLLFSTYVGDTRNFQVSGVTVGADGGVFFAGDTSNASTQFSGTSVLAAGSDAFVVGLDVVPSVPPVVQGVVNSASQVGTRIAPNQSITVLVADVTPDAEVLLDGLPLPVLSISSGRIVARIPVDQPVKGASTLQVRSGGLLSDPLLVAGATAAPAIYTADGSGRGEALVFHEDGSLNSPDNPAVPGSIIAIACNGVGRITFDGDYAVAETPVSVYVGGFCANGVDAHLLQLPGIPGDTYVIRVYVPDPKIDGFKMPALVSLTLNIGGTASSSGLLSQAEVAISIKQ